MIKRAGANLDAIDQLEATTPLHLNEMTRQLSIWQPKTDWDRAIEWINGFTTAGRKKNHNRG